jgi:hypothetical protein
VSGKLLLLLLLLLLLPLPEASARPTSARLHRWHLQVYKIAQQPQFGKQTQQ